MMIYEEFESKFGIVYNAEDIKIGLFLSLGYYHIIIPLLLSSLHSSNMTFLYILKVIKKRIIM